MTNWPCVNSQNAHSFISSKQASELVQGARYSTPHLWSWSRLGPRFGWLSLFFPSFSMRCVVSGMPCHASRVLMIESKRSEGVQRPFTPMCCCVCCVPPFSFQPLKLSSACIQRFLSGSKLFFFPPSGRAGLVGLESSIDLEF